MPETPGQAATAMRLGKIKIRTPDVAWTERFWLKGPAISDSINQLAVGAWWRSAWFGNNVQIEDGSVSVPGRPRDRYPLTKAQLTGNGAYPWAVLPFLNTFADQQPLADTNDPFVGPQYEMGTDSGKFDARFLTGVPDGDIIALRWVGSGTILAPEAPPSELITLPTAGNVATTILQARGAYLTWLVQNTLWARREDLGGPVVAGVTTYVVNSWDDIVFRRIGKHNRGGSKKFKGRRLSGS